MIGIACTFGAYWSRVGRLDLLSHKCMSFKSISMYNLRLTIPSICPWDQQKKERPVRQQNFIFPSFDSLCTDKQIPNLYWTWAFLVTLLITLRDQNHFKKCLTRLNNLAFPTFKVVHSLYTFKIVHSNYHCTHILIGLFLNHGIV